MGHRFTKFKFLGVSEHVIPKTKLNLRNEFRKANKKRKPRRSTGAEKETVSGSLKSQEGYSGVGCNSQ